MPKKELSTIVDLIKTLEDERGFLVIHVLHKFHEDVTTIHYTSCGNKKKRNGSQSLGINLNLPVGKYSGMKCYHYDFYDEIKIDFPKSNPCSKCNPTSST